MSHRSIYLRRDKAVKSWLSMDGVVEGIWVAVGVQPHCLSIVNFFIGEAGVIR